MPAGAGTDRAALQGTVGADIRVTSVAGRRPRAGTPPPWMVIATRRLYTIAFVAAHASGVHARVGAAARRAPSNDGGAGAPARGEARAARGARRRRRPPAARAPRARPCGWHDGGIISSIV